MKAFKINEYLEQKTKIHNLEIKKESTSKMDDFFILCENVKNQLDQIDAQELHEEKTLERQRKALIGETKEVTYYKNKIKDILRDLNLINAWYPKWYPDIPSAVYHEILGFAGIAEWIQGATEKLRDSSSCKIIGDRIYFYVDGELVLQNQRINKERRTLLRETFLLTDATKNRAAPYHEVYLNDGSRVTLYNDTGLTKIGQDCIVLRKYFVNTYTFEEQAKRGTIPDEAIPLFENMVKIGYNVAFTGPVRSAKTTFLTTWQSYENPQLEGLLIETDPEIPMHEIMPNAPIMQLVPREEFMDIVISTAKRSDARYVILGEARDGKLLNIAVEAANMGTRRSKVTFHNSETIDFCYDVAEKITKDCGGNLMATMIKVAKSFHFVANFFSLPSDQSQKRLKGLWEIRYNNENMEISMHQICKYIIATDSWVWAYDLGIDKVEIGMEENAEALKEFRLTLKKLATKYPNIETHAFIPPYMKALGGLSE